MFCFIYLLYDLDVKFHSFAHFDDFAVYRLSGHSKGPEGFKIGLHKLLYHVVYNLIVPLDLDQIPVLGFELLMRLVEMCTDVSDGLVNLSD